MAGPQLLATASLSGDRVTGPTPTLTFAEHHAAITQMLVVGPDRVVSVDRDRGVVVWNPQSGAVLSRHELPATAVARSVFEAANGMLAYVTCAGGTVAICALTDHGVLASAAVGSLPEIAFGHAMADLSRVLLASGGELLLVSMLDAEPLLARIDVETHEPEVLSIAESPHGFHVGFHHVGMDMYPTDEVRLYDTAKLTVVRHRAELDPFAAGSPFHGARVDISGANVHITLANHRLLSTLIGHASAVCLTAWIVADEALLTADYSGAIVRWQLDLPTLAVPLQHGKAVTRVCFHRHGALSLSTDDTKLWDRDGALVATLPAFTTLVVADDDIANATRTTLRRYSLVDGKDLGAHGIAPGETTLGARGRISVGLGNAQPNDIVSQRDGRPHPVPSTFHGFMSASPIVHAGRILVCRHLQPLRSYTFDTFELRATAAIHGDSCCWVALHPDGTLYTAGYDGELAASNFLTLAVHRRWRAFRADEGSVTAAVLLPKRGQIVIAADRRVRRVALDEGLLGRLLRGAAECTAPGKVEALVANAAETRVVAFLAGGTARVLDVEDMDWTSPRDGELEAARERRTPFTNKAGFEQAFACGDEPWLVGWSRALEVTPRALDDRTLRTPFWIRSVPMTSDVHATLVDDGDATLWLQLRDGALLRASLEHEQIETVATLPRGTLAWVTPSIFALHDDTSALHYFRTSGERICTIEQFPRSHRAYAETAAVCTGDGSLLAVMIADGTRISLSDPRAAPRASAVAIAPPFVASLHGRKVLRWDLRTGTCTGDWATSTAITAIDIRADGSVLAGDASGGVTLLR